MAFLLLKRSWFCHSFTAFVNEKEISHGAESATGGVKLEF